MTIDEVMKALDMVKEAIHGLQFIPTERAGVYNHSAVRDTRGGYFRVGNVAIKIAEITDLTN